MEEEDPKMADLVEKLFASEQWLDVQGKIEDLTETDEFKTLKTWPAEFKELRDTPEWMAVFNRKDLGAFLKSEEF